MTVASVTEISAASSKGFEEAIREGIERANKTLRNIQSAWVKDMNVLIDDGQIRATRSTCWSRSSSKTPPKNRHLWRAGVRGRERRLFLAPCFAECQEVRPM
jgi:flavin-binding protein dodecin